MNINDYPEIKPKTKIIKKIYLWIILFIFGRAFQSAARVDRGAKEEFANLPADFCLDLCVLPNGPHMIVGKNENGSIKYMGWNPREKKITLYINIKNMEAAIKMFTFQESYCTAFARDRLLVDGDLAVTCGVLRLLDILEILLLPKVVAGLGVKRYPRWPQFSPFRKYASRILIYIRLVV